MSEMICSCRRGVLVGDVLYYTKDDRITAMSSRKSKRKNWQDILLKWLLLVCDQNSTEDIEYVWKYLSIEGI